MPATAATRPWGPSRTSRPSPNSCREGAAMTIRSVGIIGAGFAGLSTAKVLRAFGFEVTVFEKEPDVGGVWAASRRYPEWPSGQQVQAYLQSYAEHFGLVPFLRMSTTVESAVLDEEAGVWTVQARRAATGQGGALPAEVYRFDYLVVCNGIFSEPAVPQYPGVDVFVAAGGRVCHTSQFNDAGEARGKHVLVVGYGKSSCDVANAIAADSASTTVLARHLIWKIPKKFMNVLNFKFLLLTRMG